MSPSLIRRQDSTQTCKRSSRTKGANSSIAGGATFLTVPGEPLRKFRKKQNDTWFTGLHNFGNTCYFNAVLVGLYACPVFRQVILSANLAQLPQDDFLVALQKLYEEMVETRSPSLNPRSLFSKLTKLQPEWTTQNQQDAHEFLNFILNYIDDQLKLRQKTHYISGSAPSSRIAGIRRKGSSRLPLRASRSPTSSPTPGASLGSEDSESGPVGMSCRGARVHSELPKLRGLPSSGFASHHRRMGGEPRNAMLGSATVTSRAATAEDIVSVFEGSLAHNTRCLYCDHTSSRIEKYLDLPVDLSNDLEQSIRRLRTAEYLEKSEKYQCEKCCMPQAAARFSELRHVPDILVIQLKRFKYDPKRNVLSKINDACYIPLNLQVKTPMMDETYFRSCSLPEALAKIQAFISFTDSRYPPSCRTFSPWIADGVEPEAATHARLPSSPDPCFRQPFLPSSQSISNCLQTEMDKGLVKLELTAIICHIGTSIFTGHYVTVARQSSIVDSVQLKKQKNQEDGPPAIGDSEWCLIDDDSVSPLSQYQMERFFGISAVDGKRSGSLKSQMGGLLDIRNAYLLFYTKITQGPL